MKQRVVSLTDRGRGLEWLSLGFGIWLIASLLFALMLAEAKLSTAPDLEGVVEPARALAVVACAVQLVAVAAIALGVATLIRCGQRLWFGGALSMLAVLLIDTTAVVWLPWIDLGDRTADWTVIFGVGSAAELFLVTSVLLGIRELASEDGGKIPVSAVSAVIGAEIARLVLVAGVAFDEWMLRHDPMLPWARAALVAVASLASIGLLLLAIRVASGVVRAQIWAGQPGVSSPARAADWKRAAAGLDRFGAFLIGKIAIAAAAVPVFIVGALVGLDAFEAIRLGIVPIASAVCSAGMVAALLASRRIPDPPDARTSFTGAAVLVAACLVADIYVLWARTDQPLAGAISALGHLVAYVAVLRSIGRIGERLGEEEFTRRARALGWLAIGAVGAASIAGYLLLQGGEDIALWFVVPITVAGVAFAALLPCAMLSRQLARRLRARFAEPPRAVARVQPS